MGLKSVRAKAGSRNDKGIYMNYAIAVAGPIGAGKSSLVRGIVNQLHDSSTLIFDHYESITRKAPHELVQWINEGADFDKFSIPGLAGDLEKLKRGESVTDPVTAEIIESRKYIVFEMPFGRAHAETAQFIDLLIWIDLPLDVALARKLREHTGMFIENFQPERHQERLSWLQGYLDNYTLFVHDILLIQLERVRPAAEFLLDGTESIEVMSSKAAKFIRTKLT
jgi:uridine kinase